jgi:glycosyltransferase involved in cell wall biosynthesis
MMRKLLFFTDADPGPVDAPPDTVPDKRGFVAALAAHGVEGEYVVFYDKPWNPLADRHAIWRAIDPARALWAITRRRDAAAILSFAESGILVPLLLRPFHRIRLAVLHDSDHQDWRPRKLIQAFVLPRADLVLTQTKAQARYLAAQYRLRRPPVYVGPRIDEQFFRPMSQGPGDYVLAVGNDSARDFATLVAAAAPLDMRVVLLTRLAVRLPAEARCRFEVIDRRLSFRELRDLYAGARIVALPMHERISPGGMTSLLEAMAMGRTSVLTASSGVVELAADGETALVTSLGDVEAFRSALATLWQDPVRCTAMGEAARARFVSEYSTDRFAARIAAALADVAR